MQMPPATQNADRTSFRKRPETGYNGAYPGAPASVNSVSAVYSKARGISLPPRHA